MKIRLTTAIFLLVLLTTINFNKKTIISKFNLQEIKVENNFIIKEEDIKKLLIPIYNKNLIFLKNREIEEVLLQNNFIDSFNIKKIYPRTLKVKIFEKRPIAILFNKKDKFYLSEKIDLIRYLKLPDYENLPYVFGNKNDFKILYNDLNKINFPLNQIKKFILYESKRWDLETKNEIIIKLPSKDYVKSLQNYLKQINNDNFRKYKVFDYRINNQLILK
tara:strand:+ start:1140 stop:1796 length:657 start_codon:yes stop_codon:yes gene_type:complete